MEESDSEMGVKESSCVTQDTPQGLKATVDDNLRQEMHETGSEDTAYFAGALNDVTFGGDNAIAAPDDAGGAAHQAALEQT